jgi:hypothetical protein
MPKPKIVQSVCHSVAMIGAFASLAVLPETALAQTVPTIVLNPATHPALTRSVDDPGRVAYQSTSSLFGCGVNISCGIGFPVTPMGYRLVIQYVSILLVGDTDTTFSFAAVSLGINSGVLPARASFIAGGFANRIAATQPVLVYIDGGGGRAPEVLIEAQGVGGATATTGSATVAGYLLDCSATPCNPIAGE